MSRGYIMQHDLHIVLETLVGEALKERPEDPLIFIAGKLMGMRDAPPMLSDVLRDVVSQKLTTDTECEEFLRERLGASRAGDAAAAAAAQDPSTPADGGALSPRSTADGLSSPKPSSPAQPMGAVTSTTTPEAARTGSGVKSRKQITINARACSVCGRDDRPGEQRKNGFKCKECIGLPSNPLFKKQIEEAQELLKGRDEDGQFALNDYRIITNIGQGAYGKVRLCVHNKSNQNYAVKFLSKEKLAKKMAGGNPNADSKEGIKQIREEIAIMKALQHPNIIQIYGTMESDTEMMIVMEHLAGQIFTNNYPAEPLPLRKLKRYIVGIANGLQFLHDKLIVHRDIKPDNILLDHNDNVKLADFGVSAFAPEGEDGLMVSGFAGSPFFMPPEQFADAGNDTKSSVDGIAGDVWSFGVTLYAMAMGNLPPFKGNNITELGASIASTDIEFDHENDLMNDVLRRMLEKKPQERITIDQLIHHDLLRDVRIVKGHPVETIELSLKYDPELAQVKEIGPDTAGDLEGADILCEFLRKSKEHFQIIQGNPYEVTLYDLARDPRRQTRTKAPVVEQKPADKIVEEDWDSDDVEEECF
eukprot:Rhum_TRINITY_DN8497_c0_g1::Rhum_TRINITY_DN8497_c0_g1_i1::g.28243::m.28243/K07359/CAMKK2; calcium/calmodulin-dependent protein kinase kinase 2